MTPVTTLFTRAQYDLLPEGFPAQLIEGCLIREPSPTYGHQRLSTRILQRLLNLCEPDLLLTAPADVAVDDLNVYQPDLLVLRRPGRDDKSEVGIPLLAIEILSPSTANRDRSVKRHRLLAAGVREVWLVDADAGRIERWSVDGCIAAEAGESVRSEALPGFSLAPDELFTPPK
jgi:Uma2 family endonuclease